MTNAAYTPTKNELYEYVGKITGAYDETNEREFTTNRISEKLNISRNLASQYLNELVKEELFIKINSRPVYFFDKKALEKKYEIRLDRNVWFGLQEMLNAIRAGSGAKKGFERAIGCHSRLRHSIEKLKSALNYPPNGLPVLIYGASGTGKSYLTYLAHEYALDRQLIGKNGKLVVFHCAEYVDDQDKAMHTLFGGRQGEDGQYVKGYLEAADEGLLRLDDVECLGPEALDKLYYFMDMGEYQEMGGTAWKKAKVRLMFTTTCRLSGEGGAAAQGNPEQCLAKNLLRRIPIVIRMPLLSERTKEEKCRFLVSFFKEEAKRTECEFFVSQKTFDAMLGYGYPGNINQMRNCVKITCANALQKSDKDSRKNIYFYHLPDRIIRTVKVRDSYDESADQMVDILNYQDDSSLNKILEYYEKLLAEFKKYRNMEASTEAFTGQAGYLADLYYDYLAFENNYSSVEIHAVEQVLNQILSQMEENYRIYLPANCGYILSREIYVKDQLGQQLTQWEERSRKEIDEIFGFCSQNFHEEFQLAEVLQQRISKELELPLNRVEEIFFLLQVRKNNQVVQAELTRGIIICHGYSTASSIADTVNKVLGRNWYTAFDMPYESSLADLQERLVRCVKRMVGCRDLIILVDLGSVEDVDVLLKQIPDINLAIVNNVSTRLALSIGGKIMEQPDLESMLKAACQAGASRYRVIRSRKKEKAILFVSESGIPVAQRFSELFLNSLPKKVEVKLIPCDYTYFLDEGHEEELLEQYDILFAAGTIDPRLKEIPYVSMEDMMSFKKIELVHKGLSGYLTKGEMEQFDKNLLQNFSLQNVVSYLTILNPGKVLEMVGEALDRLQEIIGRKWRAKTIIGLNIHMSCLLERLITKQPLETYGNIERFEEEQREFIDDVRESFSRISAHYGVTIPVEEVAYIYDYVAHDED